jgi:T4 RnlA family RNA ligase
VFYLPSYEECLSICEKTNNTLFFESIHYVDGFKISIFNYRLATYQDFLVNNSFELRGLTFVFNSDGSLFKRFLLMEKFFNINENESTELSSIKHKKINSVYEKVDGSIISFISLPNGKILAKSKTSFTSDQAIMAQNIFNQNCTLKIKIKEFIDNNIVPIFELVSPRNQIVLKYSNDDLILLRLRNNADGQYLPIDEYPYSKPKQFSYDLDTMSQMKGVVQNVEGWIVEFSDFQKIKIKTDWYLSLHKTMTETCYREDYVISMILDNKIDDLLSLLDIGTDARNFVESVINIVNSKFRSLLNKVDEMVSEYDGDKKEFSLKFHKEELFSVTIKVIGGGDKFQLLSEFIKKKTYRLESARTWVWE